MMIDRAAVVSLALSMAAFAAPAGAETRTPGVEERRDALLGELAACESGHHPNPSGNTYLGRYQFSTATVIAFVRERDGRTLTAAEARALARDDARAGALARYVIFERAGWTHWPACSRKLRLPVRVPALRRS
jgi:hypothetical protein